MPNVTIYHNPRCSKSRKTLELLEENNIKPTIIEYLQTPPTMQELEEIAAMLELHPRDFIRKRESAYKENQLDNPELTEEELLTAMANNPILIERPIVVCNNKAVIGRPPENVLEII